MFAAVSGKSGDRTPDSFRVTKVVEFVRHIVRSVEIKARKSCQFSAVKFHRHVQPLTAIEAKIVYSMISEEMWLVSGEITSTQDCQC